MFKTSFIILAVLSAALGSPTNPEPRPDQGWLNRHENFVKNTQASNGSIPILFYGASIVDFWGSDGKAVWDEKYAPLGATNYGIAGDRIEHVLWRVLNGEIRGLNPKLIVLHIGGNNIFTGADTDKEIAEGIANLITVFRYMLPSTKILYLGILPRGNADAFVHVANINIQNAPVDNGNSVRYLNMMDQFSSSWGVVKPELFQSDNLHLRLAGYQTWDKLMSKIFNEMLQ